MMRHNKQLRLRALMRAHLGWLVIGVVSAMSACGSDAERAVQSARLSALEQEIHQLHDQLAKVESAKQAPGASAAQQSPVVHASVIRIECPQPWVQHAPLGSALWTCRSPSPTPDGIYPQCSVVFQPQIAIETKDYFEFANNAVPQLRDIRAFKDQHIQHQGHDAFQVTFESESKFVPLKALGMLLPHGESTYALTCSAPSATFGNYERAFRTIIDGFALR